MILAVDVDYRYGKAQAAGLLFYDWQDEVAQATATTIIDIVADYVPGSFYKRELPCIMALLKAHELSVDTIVIDGYVLLDGIAIAGLGKHLFNALDQKVNIIGVAKSPYHTIGESFYIYRGYSDNPLYVTSAGIPVGEAKRHIESMAGAYRIPTLLKEVDRASRCWGTVRSKQKNIPY